MYSVIGNADVGTSDCVGLSVVAIVTSLPMWVVTGDDERGSGVFVEIRSVEVIWTNM